MALSITSFKDFLHRWMVSGFLAAIEIVDKISGTNNQHPALLQRRALNSLLQIAGPQGTESRFQWIQSHQRGNAFLKTEDAIRFQRRIGEQWPFVSGGFPERQDEFLRPVANYHQFCVYTLKSLYVVIEVGNLPSTDHSTKMPDKHQNNSFIFPQCR